MNLKELKERIDFIYDNLRNNKTPENTPVYITLNNSSIGGRAHTGIKSIGLGFDWEEGQIRVETEERIFKENIRKVIKKDSLREVKEISKIVVNNRMCYTCTSCTGKVSKKDKYCKHCSQRLK